MKLFFSMLMLAGLLYSNTLSIVKTRGHLLCGVSGDLPGFSLLKKNVWSGLDIDYCRALAVAIFNDKEKVKFIKVAEKNRFKHLRDMKYDILARNTTWNFRRDTSIGIKFAGVTYYDGQGFLVLSDFGLNSSLELHNAKICISTHSTGRKNIKHYFENNNMKYKEVLGSGMQSIINFEKGRCDTITDDKSGLYSLRSTLKDPSLYKVLPETISKEPLGPAVRNGDDAWLDIARWVITILLEAEELKINKKNVFLFLESKNPQVQRLLGTNNSINTIQGLKNDWSYNVIFTIGSYKDIFDKNLANSGLKIDRGLNALWNEGGLMYPLSVK